MDKEISGVIKKWNDQKGFGFIASDKKPNVFFHITTLHGNRRPQIGDKVFYIPTKDQQGRIVARHVRHSSPTVDNPDIRKRPVQDLDAPLKDGNKKAKIVFQHIQIKLFVFILLLVPVVTGVVQLWVYQRFPWIALLYIVTSAIAFFLYWIDKKRAGTDASRIPESRLHFFELLGGWIGAFIAQQLFRHKTRKISFQIIFWLIVIVHEVFWIDRVFLNGSLVYKLVTF